MNPKIGIMTYYAVANYGAVLQAYALQQNLVRLGADVEFLRFYDKHNEQRPSNNSKSIVENLNSHVRLLNERLFHSKRYYRKKGKIRNSSVLFKSFRDEYLNVSREPYYDLNDLKDSNSIYDAFITGSDMVWTPIGQNLSAYFLQFSDNRKRLSYAPSMTGCSNYSKEIEKTISDFLQSMRLVSCREKEGIDYVKKLIGKKAKLTLDPTLLFTQEEWRKELGIEKKGTSTPYLLCYMFGGMPNDAKKKVAIFAKEHNMCVRYIPQNAEEIDNELCAQQKVPYSPREFVELFLNASFVVTNSFHGMIFSLIGEKPFVVYHRGKSNAWKINETRISDLLSYLGIEERFIETKRDIDRQFAELDYTTISTLIDNSRKESLDYLSQCISIAIENSTEIQNKKESIINVRDLPRKICTGCGLCEYVCSKDAIKMKADEEGFLYPTIDNSKCIECGLCAKKCPSSNPNEKRYPIQTIIGVSKDAMRENSASGGVFITIAKYIIEEYRGVVYGCVLDEQLRCRHVEASSMKELAPMQNSKYTQSDIGNCYILAKKRLDKGQYVLFTGTPCQIAGLKSFIGKDYERLLTIEIICHGVPNHKYWNYYIRNLSKKKPLLSYTFRNRSNRKLNKGTFEATLVYSDKVKHIDCYNDPFYASYVRNESFRPSCYYCQYARKERLADITIGDCDSQKDYPFFFPDESKSAILLNSEKGTSLWEKIGSKFEWMELDYRKEWKINTTLSIPSPRPVERDIIYKDLISMQWKLFEKKYIRQQSFLRKVLKKCRSLMK